MGWYEYGTDNLVSNQTPYTFTMTSNVKLTAKWPSTAVTYTLTTLNDKMDNIHLRLWKFYILLI